MRRFSKLLAVSLAAFCLAHSFAADTIKDEILQTLDKLPHPATASDFPCVPHLSCLQQGKTMICWSFATSSFVEAEMTRLGRPSVRLSVMYPVYCQFLEKAKRYVRTKGSSRLAPGDLFIGVMGTCQQYGEIPASAYDSQLEHQALDQSPLYAELDTLMERVKKNKDWNEERFVTQVKRLLNRHLGEPPKTFSFEAKSYTPKTFAEEVVRLPWAEYVMLTSFQNAPFDHFTDLRVPDNWQHNTNFLNVPLPVFYDTFKSALRGGFSVAVSIDTSEPSYSTTGRYCFVPDCDVPSTCISQAAREFRFVNGATTDDHAVHVLGYKDIGGEDWFLAKDSWKTAWRDGNQGNLFLHSSYVKLKVLAFIVHRAGLPESVAQLARKN